MAKLKKENKITATTFTPHRRGYNYIVNMRKDLKITHAMLNVYAEIEGIYNKFKNCKVSNAYLAGLLCVSPHQISQMVSKLEKANLITVKTGKGNIRMIEINTKVMGNLIEEADVYFASLKDTEEKKTDEVKIEKMGEFEDGFGAFGDEPKEIVTPEEQPKEITKVKKEETVVIKPKVTKQEMTTEHIEEEISKAQPLTKAQIVEELTQEGIVFGYGLDKQNIDLICDMAVEAGVKHLNKIEKMLQAAQLRSMNIVELVGEKREMYVDYFKIP